MPSAQIRIHLGGNDRASHTFLRVTHPDGHWTEYRLAGTDSRKKLVLLDDLSRRARATLYDADVGGPVQPLSASQYRSLMSRTQNAGKVFLQCGNVAR